MKISLLIAFTTIFIMIKGYMFLSLKDDEHYCHYSTCNMGMCQEYLEECQERCGMNQPCIAECESLYSVCLGKCEENCNNCLGLCLGCLNNCEDSDEDCKNGCAALKLQCDGEACNLPFN
jgi:hypothetical protein